MLGFEDSSASATSSFMARFAALFDLGGCGSIACCLVLQKVVDVRREVHSRPSEEMRELRQSRRAEACYFRWRISDRNTTVPLEENGVVSLRVERRVTEKSNAL